MNHKLPQSKPGRRRFFQGQSLAAALVYCPACGLAGVLFQAIGFDYGHALDILQYRRHQIHLRMLPGRGGLPHGPLAQFCHTQITEDTADCKQSEPPVGYEQGQTQRQCVQEPADHHDQAPGGGVLHIPQSSRDHGGDIAQGVLVEIAHWDIPQAVADVYPFLRYHVITGVSLRIGGAVETDGTPGRGQQQDAENERDICHPARKQSVQGQHQRSKLQRGKHCTQKGDQHGVFQRSPLAPGKNKNFL